MITYRNLILLFSIGIGIYLSKKSFDSSNLLEKVGENKCSKNIVKDLDAVIIE